MYWFIRWIAGSSRKESQRGSPSNRAHGQWRAAYTGVQALSEFSNVCLRKLRSTLAPEEVRLEVERLTLAFPVLPLTPLVVSEVLRGVQEHSFSYYDAQVWAVARLGQVAGILSEDFNTGLRSKACSS